jgi:hypothetical protein
MTMSKPAVFLEAFSAQQYGTFATSLVTFSPDESGRSVPTSRHFVRKSALTRCASLGPNPTDN